RPGRGAASAAAATASRMAPALLTTAPPHRRATRSFRPDRSPAACTDKETCAATGRPDPEALAAATAPPPAPTPIRAAPRRSKPNRSRPAAPFHHHLLLAPALPWLARSPALGALKNLRSKRPPRARHLPALAGARCRFGRPRAWAARWPLTPPTAAAAHRSASGRTWWTATGSRTTAAAAADS